MSKHSRPLHPAAAGNRVFQAYAVPSGDGSGAASVAADVSDETWSSSGTLAAPAVMAAITVADAAQCEVTRTVRRRRFG